MRLKIPQKSITSRIKNKISIMKESIGFNRKTQVKHSYNWGKYLFPCVLESRSKWKCNELNNFSFKRRGYTSVLGENFHLALNSKNLLH